MKSLIKSFEEIHPRALLNIRKADERNKDYYDKRHTKQPEDLKFGDAVLVKIPKVTKLGPKAKGPFHFNRYLNGKLNAELIDNSKVERKVISGKTYVCGKTFVESTSNIAKT